MKKESKSDNAIKKIIAFGVVISVAIMGIAIYVNKPGVWILCLGMILFEVIETIKMCRHIYQVDTEIKKIREETEEVKHQIRDIEVEQSVTTTRY